MKNYWTTQAKLKLRIDPDVLKAIFADNTMFGFPNGNTAKVVQGIPAEVNIIGARFDKGSIILEFDRECEEVRLEVSTDGI